MSKLERWLPFRFNRKKEQEQNQASQSHNSTLAPMAGAWPSPLGPFHSPLFSTPMNQLVQSLFNDPFFRDPFGQFDKLDRWFGDFSPKRYSPSVEVVDDGKAIKVTVELPGMSKDDVTLQLEDNVLTISGEKKHEQEAKDDGVFRTERYYGYFHRTIPLPEEIDRDAVDADFKKGVLTVRLPKLLPEKPRGKKIEVKAA
jgi:HSP20 family protein